MTAAHRRANHRHAICTDLDRMGALAVSPTPGYLIVMVDHGRRGREAVVDPEETRSGIIDRIRSKDYGAIAFIHHILDGQVTDVTNELLAEAGFYDEAEPQIDRVAARNDHSFDYRKNWSA